MKRSLTSSRLGFVVLAACALTLVVAPAALSGKGGNGGKPSGGSSSSSLTLVVLNSTDGLPHYGQQVTFDVSTTATTSPYVNLRCYQNGVLVGQSWEAFFAGSLDDQIMVLGGSLAWQSGAADCTATLNKRTNRGWQQLASTSFHVYV